MTNPIRALGTMTLLGVLLVAPQPVYAARTFQSLTITPPSTNVTAGATFTANVALTTKVSSGTTASGQVTNSVSISPSASGVTLAIDPGLYVIGTSLSGGQTSNSTLTVTTSAAMPPNTYVVEVVVAAGPDNPNLASIIPITNTFSLTAGSAASDSFSMSVAPAWTNVFAGAATNVTATVHFVGNSSTLSGTVTNGVTVTGPDPLNVTASLNSIHAPITNNFGETNLLLSIAATANAAPGTYEVIVRGTNSSFTANSPLPGIASATNIFVITDSNSFSMSVSHPVESAFAGTATNLTVAVTLVNRSPVMAGTLTNGVTVVGPDTNVTASLESTLVSPAPGGGTAGLALTLSIGANATNGTYQVIIGATNHNFTANSPIPGIALVTNILILVEPPPHPYIQSVSLSGTTLMIAGTNGLPGGEYTVLASTNAALPLPQWMPFITNNFDEGGNFSLIFGITNPLDPDAVHHFFLLSSSGQGTVVDAPTFDPPAAAYPSEQAVTISSTTSGASIRYTMDGSTPSATHGTLYTGPVAILGPVVTNLSGTFTNASGVTMLKAIAYQSGLLDSPVFTGNYQIMVPPPASSSSPLRGIAHLAYRVTDLAAARQFWKDYLGFAEPFLLPTSNTVAVIKINDQQYVELYEGPVVPPQYQLVNYGYQVNDAEAYRQQLAAAGVSVPTGVSTNALGNLSFFSTDPDGHAIEWVQYLTNSLTGQSRGQAMPRTQVFGYIISTGGFTSNSYAMNNAFYLTQCGFLPNGSSGINSHLINIPNSDGFYEHGSYNTLDAPTAGKKSQIDLLNFRGITIQESVAILESRDPSIVIDLHLTSKGRYVGNIYDPDGIRVELDDQ